MSPLVLLVLAQFPLDVFENSAAFKKLEERDGFTVSARVLEGSAYQGLWGEWRIEAVPAGGAKLTYTMFSDPAGAVPSFVVHGSQRKAALDSTRMALQKTKKFVEAGK